MSSPYYLLVEPRDIRGIAVSGKTFNPGLGVIATGVFTAGNREVDLAAVGQPIDYIVGETQITDLSAGMLVVVGTSPVYLLAGSAITARGLLKVDANGAFVPASPDIDANIQYRALEDAATNEYAMARPIGKEISQVLPGSIMLHAGSSAPSGWLLCDGSEVSRATYSAIFSAIGTSHGVGNGTTTFNLPDFRERFPIGKANAGAASAIGVTGGTFDHTHGSPLTTGAPSATVQATIVAGGAASPTHTHAVAIPSANPPFLVENFIIKT